MSAWRSSSNQKTGDLVVHQCSKKQATCQNLEIGVDSLFECIDSHVDNCITQYPEDGSAWTFHGKCDDLTSTGGTSGTGGTNGDGGTGGTGGAEPTGGMAGSINMAGAAP
jgi:hypothetical protein